MKGKKIKPLWINGGGFPGVKNYQVSSGKFVSVAHRYAKQQSTNEAEIEFFRKMFKDF